MNFTKKGDGFDMASTHKTDFTNMDKNIKIMDDSMKRTGLFSNNNSRLEKVAIRLGLKKNDLVNVRDKKNPSIEVNADF